MINPHSIYSLLEEKEQMAFDRRAEKDNKGKHQRRAVSLTEGRYRAILSNNYNTNTKESTNANNIKEEKVTKYHKRTYSTIRPILMKKK